MVEKVQILLLLLGVVGFLAVLAERLRFPFPILLVFAGLVIGFIPQMPEIRLDPQLIFIVFLPPLLFSAAWNFPLEDFRSNLIPIFALAVGLVFATMTGVAYAAFWMIPGLTLAVGFVLGAIVSPPDAVAANAVLKNLDVPKRLSTLLEGESLVNDASGLVAYQFAVAAVVTGSFSMAHATGDFLWGSIGGVLYGWLLGFLIAFLHRGLSDPAVEITLTILTPYLAYLPSEQMGFSGVLSVVTTGLYLGHNSWKLLTSESRLQRETIWRFLDYMLNGFVFILMGVQFPAILEGVKAIPTPKLILLGLVISLVVVAVRFAWIFPMAFLRRAFLPDHSLDQVKRKGLIIASWAGMRGVVSLAAALALPENFPHRPLVLFLVFCVIFFTLVVQGLSLPWLVRWLGVKEPEPEHEPELKIRVELMDGLIAEIDALQDKTDSESQKAALGLWHDQYASRRDHMRTRISKPALGRSELVSYEVKIFPEMLQHVRERLAQMRRDGTLSEEARKRIEYDFDMEERRIEHMLSHYAAKKR